MSHRLGQADPRCYRQLAGRRSRPCGPLLPRQRLTGLLVRVVVGTTQRNVQTIRMGTRGLGVNYIESRRIGLGAEYGQEHFPRTVGSEPHRCTPYSSYDVSMPARQGGDGRMRPPMLKHSSAGGVVIACGRSRLSGTLPGVADQDCSEYRLPARSFYRKLV